MKASERAKQGGLKLIEMAKLVNMSREHLNHIFKTDPLRFDELLLEAMKQKLADDIFARRLQFANDKNLIERASE